MDLPLVCWFQGGGEGKGTLIWGCLVICVIKLDGLRTLNELVDEMKHLDGFVWAGGSSKVGGGMCQAAQRRKKLKGGHGWGDSVAWMFLVLSRRRCGPQCWRFNEL